VAVERDFVAGQQPDVVIVYDSVGSGEGTDCFLAGSVDSGASDAALSDEAMTKVDRGVQLIPATAGSIVIAYNVPNLSGPLKLSREVYVDIFLGKITNWSDPRIKKDNPDATFPDLTIYIAARKDSGGATFAFTNHLSSISEEWRDRGPGSGKVVDWPGSAMLAHGNEGVAGIIKRSPGTIGYVEYGMAQRTGLNRAWLENRAGNFIEPTGTSGMATLTSATLPENLRAFFPDPEGAESYPIVTYTWLLLYQYYDDAQNGGELKEFVRWCLQEGQNHCESLGYIRLAPSVVAAATAALDNIE
jgi:phosphate transport system substrate-binding protein